MTSPLDAPLARTPLIARVALIVLLVFTAIVSVTSGIANELLRAVDFLAPKPGLSGLLLVFLAPFGFLLAIALGAWAMAGIRRARAGRGAP